MRSEYQISFLVLALLGLVYAQVPLPPAGLALNRHTGDIQGPFVGVQSAAIPWQAALYEQMTPGLPSAQELHAPQPLVYSPVYVFKPYSRGNPVQSAGSNIARPATIQDEDQNLWAPADNSIEVQTDSANYRFLPGMTDEFNKDPPAVGSVAAQTQVGGPPDGVRKDPTAGYAVPYSSERYMRDPNPQPAIASPVIADSPLDANLAEYSVHIGPSLSDRPPLLPVPLARPESIQTFPTIARHPEEAYISPGASLSVPTSSILHPAYTNFFNMPPSPPIVPAGSSPFSAPSAAPVSYSWLYTPPPRVYPPIPLNRVAPTAAPYALRKPSTAEIPYPALTNFILGPPEPHIQLLSDSSAQTSSTPASPSAGAGTTSLLELSSHTKQTSSQRVLSQRQRLFARRMRWSPTDESGLNFESVSV